MIDILERWEKTTLLRAIPDKLKAEMAYILENQLYHNEHIKDVNGLSVATFRRLSIPLALRVFPKLESHKRYKIGSAPYLASCLVSNLGVKGVWYSSKDLNEELKQVTGLADVLKVQVDKFIESQAPFNTFNFQCFGTNDAGDVTLYYDIS